MKQVPRYIREIARKLRNNMTPAEVRLWARLKNEALGVKFLRQKPLYMFTEDTGQERYIIPDFYCSESKIVIEVDGGVHDNSEVLELDREKEILLKQQEISVIRVTNDDVLHHTDNCIGYIQNQVIQLSLCKRESPTKEGEGSALAGEDQIPQLSLCKREYPTKEGEGLSRCIWANPKNELYLAYHDAEWGRPVHDDRVLFEFLVLEGAQAGLSWETVLKKRENYRAAFDDFDYEKIAKYGENKIQELLGNEGIIRNKLKLRSTIKNARAFIEIRKEFGSFSEYLWAFVHHKQIINNPRDMSEVPVSTELSDTISKELKKRGMSFVGTTIIYAYLQAVGVINDHVADCFCRGK